MYAPKPDRLELDTDFSNFLNTTFCNQVLEDTKLELKNGSSLRSLTHKIYLHHLDEYSYDNDSSKAQIIKARILEKTVYEMEGPMSHGFIYEQGPIPIDYNIAFNKFSERCNDSPNLREEIIEIWNARDKKVANFIHNRIDEEKEKLLYYQESLISQGEDRDEIDVLGEQHSAAEFTDLPNNM